MEIRTIIAAFMTGVLLVFMLVGWRKIRPINRAVILSFAATVDLSTFVQVFLYDPKTGVAPLWFPPAIDIGYMIISICLTISILTNIKHKCKKL